MFNINYKKVILSFLTQGADTNLLAIAVSSGILISTFPILGTHTMISVALIFLFRLNPAAVFLFSNMFFPLFFIMIWPFYKVGSIVTGNKNQSFQMPEDFTLSYFFTNDFLAYFTHSLLHLIVGWIVLMIPIAIIVYFISKIIFSNINQAIFNQKPTNTSIQ